MAYIERFFVFRVYITKSKSLASYAMSIDVGWLRFETHWCWWFIIIIIIIIIIVIIWSAIGIHSIP